MTELCKMSWHDGMMSGPCQREAKQDGLCGPHLAGQRASDRAVARAREKEAARKQAQREADALAAAISDATGLVVHAYVTRSGFRELSLSATQAEAWLRERS